MAISTHSFEFQTQHEFANTANVKHPDREKLKREVAHSQNLIPHAAPLPKEHAKKNPLKPPSITMHPTSITMSHSANSNIHKKSREQKRERENNIYGGVVSK